MTNKKSDDKVTSTSQVPGTTNNENKKEEFSFIRSFGAGGIAGVLAKTTVSPIERVKLIFQTSSEEFTYRKGINMFKEILRTEGFLSLWRGNTLVALRIFPYSAIQFAVYDTVKHVSILIYLVS